MENNIKKENIGKLGEDIASDYLLKKKYRILERNFRIKFDEIDIIAKAFDGTLVFVEVKTLKARDDKGRGLIPEDNLTKSKFYKISRICTMFSAKHQNIVDDEKGWRIDLIAITLIGEEREVRLAHYENISI